MNTSELENIVKALSGLVEPKLKWSIVSLNLVQRVEMQEGTLVVEIHLVTDNQDEVAQFRRDCEALLTNLGYTSIRLNLRRVHIAIEGLKGVQNVILVASGKGGVGKSTVAVNLACALSSMGHSTGLMDADVYGPSVPIMLGVNSRPEVLGEEYLKPVEAHGLKVMSMGLLHPEGKSVPWRGNLVSGTIVQFLQKTLWENLNYLVIDLPPGTGDVQLTIAQKVKAKGAVIVSMPQEVVLGDVRRAVDLFENHKIPVLAHVENMSWLVCESCGHVNHPFVAASQQLPESIAYRMQLPLYPELSRASDRGVPLIVEQPEHEVSSKFKELAAGIHLQLSKEAEGTLEC